jgi:hypothetical protein
MSLSKLLNFKELYFTDIGLVKGFVTAPIPQ